MLAVFLYLVFLCVCVILIQAPCGEEIASAQKAAQKTDGPEYGPSGKSPFFIFEATEVSWSDLAPYLVRYIGNRPDFEKKIVGTFPIPGDHNGTDWQSIKFDDENIYFSGPGEYYLHTTVGFFKILIIAPLGEDDARVLSVARFASRNQVHSLVNVKLFKGRNESEIFRKLFASDQPMKLHCAESVQLVRYLLSILGYKVQILDLHDRSMKRNDHATVKSHTVMQVFLPGQDRYVYVDPDYGVTLSDSSGRLLPIQEIATLIRRNPDEISVNGFGQKHWLKDEYNLPIYMPDFKWSPDKDSDVSCADEEKYKEKILKFTAAYGLASLSKEDIVEFGRYFYVEVQDDGTQKPAK